MIKAILTMLAWTIAAVPLLDIASVATQQFPLTIHQISDRPSGLKSAHLKLRLAEISRSSAYTPPRIQPGTSKDTVSSPYPASASEANKREDAYSLHGLHPFPYDVILIDVGHGGIDGGTSHGDILEKDINLEVSRRLFMLLRKEGFHAVLNRDGDYALSDDNRWHRSRSRHQRDLAQRKQLSKEIPTEVIVSIHVNWSKNTRSRGGIVLHQAEGRSSLLAKSIQRELNQLYSRTNRVTVGKPFYLLNTTDVPAVIVETGFMSNPEDRLMLTTRKGQAAIAEAVANGIISYFAAL